MKNGNDIICIARATKAIADGLNDPVMTSSDFDMPSLVLETAANGEHTAANVFIRSGNAAIKARADMLHACILMTQEVEKIEKKTKESCKRINDEAGKMAQSLAKTKEIMGPQVEDRLKQMERFIECMERLQKLETEGALSRFSAALKSGK